MAERYQNPAAEAIPGTPVIREVRIGSGSGNFKPASAKGGGLRAEIDTTPPFEPVLDPLTGFYGGGSWDQFKIGDHYDCVREFDIPEMEKQAAKLEKNLIMKELETLDFLEALGSTKRMIQDLKLELLNQQAPRFMKSPEHNHSHIKKMNEEQHNLDKTMDDLEMIQSYVESLNMKTEKEENLHGVVSLAEELNSLRLKSESKDQDKVGSEHIALAMGQEERFNTEKSSINTQFEQVKMVTEINETTLHNQSKNCLKTAELRLVAARKMEEAARAAEELAVAEINILSRSSLTLKDHLKEGLSTNISRMEILRKLEEANEEVKQSKQALEMALSRVEIANMKQLEAEVEFRQWNIESWKDQKAIRAKRLVKEGNFTRRTFLSHVNQQHEPLIDLSKPMLKRNVLSREQVPNVDEKQLVMPKRKFRFIHIT